MPKLTKRTVDALRPEREAFFVWDDALRGFGIRVMPSGTKAYIAQYRTSHGRSRRMTIGKHGVFSTEQARERARNILQDVRDGRDPVAERRADRKVPLVSDLLDRYLAEHVERRNAPRTQEGVRWLVDHCIRPRLGAHRVAAVTRQDLAKLHHALAATPRQANHALAVCSKAFGLAELWGMRPDGSNPCRRIERYPERQRERFLSAEELTRLGGVLRVAERAGLPWPERQKPRGRSRNERRPENWRTIFRRQDTALIELLLYTGCRLSEILNLRWEHVDFEADIITLAETKAGRPQRIVMNAPARQVLKSLPQIEGSPWVLPSKRDKSGKAPMTKDLAEGLWQRFRAAAGLEDVRLHDLRHTVGTYAGQSGANAFLVRDLLRHKGLAITGRYVNKADDPVRTLSDLVGERIAAGLAGCKGANVIPLGRAGVTGT